MSKIELNVVTRVGYVHLTLKIPVGRQWLSGKVIPSQLVGWVSIHGH